MFPAPSRCPSYTSPPASLSVVSIPHTLLSLIACRFHAGPKCSLYRQVVMYMYYSNPYGFHSS
ncbi:hypothetical protein EV361DRAFT_840483 [Lentinula raphanica]|nr:hypothetical protein EV361DRAFT_840483 [Lentinula raphanica]